MSDNRRVAMFVGAGALAAAGLAGAAVLLHTLFDRNGQNGDRNRAREGAIAEVPETPPPLSLSEFSEILSSRGGFLQVKPVLEESLLTPPAPTSPSSQRLVTLPQFLDLPALTARLREEQASFFPRDVPPLSSIVVDFGRAHYFTYANSAEIAQHLHAHVYANFGTATEEERRAFFAELGIDADAALKAASEISPRRNGLVARVKYELLVRALEQAGHPHAPHRALTALTFATQHVLRYVKQSAYRALEETTHGRVPVHFSFFRLDYALTERMRLLMRVTFINYIPEKGMGVWQMQRAVSSKDPFKIRAEFEMELEEIAHPEDLGTLRLYCDGPHPHYGPKLPDEVQKKTWGLYDADSDTTIRFGDTSPTW